MTELLFRDDAYRRECDATVTAVVGNAVELDRTVFYPMGGGQPGDTGRFVMPDGNAIAVIDTTKGGAGVVHVLAPDAATPPVGAKVRAEIDWERRHRLMRMHTCLHLLSAVLTYPVTGGSVGDGKGRLDFDIPEATLDKDAISTKLNDLIAANHAVGTQWITDEELAAKPELVKTMSVKPPTGAGKVRLVEISGLDLQPCGGTHVARTGEIGKVIVAKIEKKGKLNRRVAVEFA